MNRKIIYISLITSLFISGCSFSGQNAINFRGNDKRENISITSTRTVNVCKGDILYSVIEEFRRRGVNIIVGDKKILQYRFQDSLNNVTLEDVLTYLNNKYNINLTIEFRGFNLAYLTNKKKKEKKRNRAIISYLVKSFKELDKLKELNKKLDIRGPFTYNDLFYLLSKSGIKVHFKLSDKDKVFNRDKVISNYYGTIKDFLKDLSLESNLFIKVKGKNIYFSDKITKYYTLKLQPVQISTSDNFNNIMVDAVKPLEDLQTQLETLVKEHGTFNINKTDGTLTVHGDEYALTVCDEIVDNFNEIYGKSVKLELNIYEVELSDEKAAGLDLKNIVNHAFDLQYKVNVNLATNIQVSENSPITSIIIGDKKGDTFDDKLFFKFLNQYGKTRVVTKPILETVNNLPVTMDFTQEIDYVKKIEERITRSIYTDDNNDNNRVYNDNIIDKTVDIDVDTFKSGFMLSLLPRIEEDNTVKIVLKPKITKLIGLIPYEYGDEENRKMIQLKNSSHKEISQIIKVRDGEVAIIGGYITDKTGYSKNGLPFVGNDDNPLDILTSSRNRNRTKSELIFTIKASILK